MRTDWLSFVGGTRGLARLRKWIEAHLLVFIGWAPLFCEIAGFWAKCLGQRLFCQIPRLLGFPGCVFLYCTLVLLARALAQGQALPHPVSLAEPG